MSLLDKQKSLQFGAENDVAGEDRWKVASGQYATQGNAVSDPLETQEAIRQNTLAFAQNSGVTCNTPQGQTVDMQVQEQAQNDIVDRALDKSMEGVQAVSTESVVKQSIKNPDINTTDATRVVPSLATNQVSSDIDINAETEIRGQHTILIIDDDVETREMYAEIFRIAHFRVLEAGDGLAGLDIVTKQRPDIIFTGIIMPRMDGFTMVEAIRKNSVIAGTPIIINSHLGRELDKKRALELGIKDFIVRGYISPREVVDRVEIILTSKEYLIPLDSEADYTKAMRNDLGGASGLLCPEGKMPMLQIRVTDRSDKTFSARILCK